MKLGVLVQPGEQRLRTRGLEYRAALELALRAEQGGFASVWLVKYGEPDELILEGALAVQTRQIQIGLCFNRPEDPLSPVVRRRIEILTDLAGERLDRGVLYYWEYSLSMAARAAEQDLVLVCSYEDHLRQLRPLYRAELERLGRGADRAGDIVLVRQVVLADTRAEAQGLVASLLSRLDDEDDRDMKRSRLVAGEPESVAEWLWKLQAEIGDFQLLLDLSGPGTAGDLLRSSMERFSREIIPLFTPQPAMPPTWA